MYVNFLVYFILPLRGLASPYGVVSQHSFYCMHQNGVPATVKWCPLLPLSGIVGVGRPLSRAHP
jgi:hypothetical protein